MGIDYAVEMASLFSSHVSRGLVFPYAINLSAAMIVRRPFSQFELPNEHRHQPVAFLHLHRRKFDPPPPASRLGKIGEWALMDMKTFKCSKKIGADGRCKTVPCAGDVDEFSAFETPQN
jgi:hypothetical protein